MSFDANPNNYELFLNIANKICKDITAGDFALLGVYLPEPVLRHVAEMTGEVRNGFGYNNGRAELRMVSPLLSRVLDNVRNSEAPNRRWCVLVKNIARIFEMSRGSLCGADLSGLDLTECDFSTTALSSLGLCAKLDNSLIRFDSFLRYRVPGLKRDAKPSFAIDVDSDGDVIMGCGGAIMRICPKKPLLSRLICDISAELGEGWQICKLRFSREIKSLLISATNDIDAFDTATSLHPYTEGNVSVRQWIFDGRNLIACHGERETAPGAVLRENAFGLSAYLEGREIARIKERHCWELETGDPVRDELSAKDRIFSGDLRYKYENNRITERQTHRALAFVYAGAVQRFQSGTELCRVNPTAADCDFSHIHPNSPISAEEIEILKSTEE